VQTCLSSVVTFRERSNAFVHLIKKIGDTRTLENAPVYIFINVVYRTLDWNEYVEANYKLTPFNGIKVSKIVQ